MVQELLPGLSLAKGRFRRALVQSLSSVSLSTSSSTQSEVDIPIRGDVYALEFVLTVSASGTLSSPQPLDRAIQELSIKDRGGVSIWSKIRGRDLSILDRYFNIGRSRSVSNTSNSNQTHRFFIVNPIKVADQDASVQVTLAPYSDLATSGATGGTVSLDVIAYYVGQGTLSETQRLTRLSQSIVSGTNRFAPNLPKGKNITDLLFTVGTESNITNINFSADGRAELAEIRPTDLTAIDDVRLVSGHVTGEFSMYVTPFVADTNTQLDVEGAGSDTIQWYIVQAS